MAKRIILVLVIIILSRDGFGQFPRVSFATDFAAQRSFKKEQKYWAVGQTVKILFHITSKEGVYTWFSYYTNGNYKNSLVADAKSISTIPQQIDYINRGKMRLKQFSLGYHKYFKGTPDAELGWNLYAYGGFGLLLGRVINTHNVALDTSQYNVPVLAGKANFKRLTVDLGIGWETPIGGDFYFYTEGKAWIPTTDYPSKFIFINNNAPLVAMFQVGLRLLF